MKKFGLLMLVACGAVAIWACGSRDAAARPPYKDIFLEHYKDNAKVAAAGAEAKCAICHSAKDKKVRNDYGKAVSKNTTKKDFDALKDDKPALAKKLIEALKLAEEEKNADGKKFGDLLKDGKLPGTPLP